MPEMISSSFGCSVGSPPVTRIFRTPSEPATFAIREISVGESNASGGWNCTSGSMQYTQRKLQRSVILMRRSKMVRPCESIIRLAARIASGARGNGSLMDCARVRTVFVTSPGLALKRFSGIAVKGDALRCIAVERLSRTSPRTFLN